MSSVVQVPFPLGRLDRGVLEEGGAKKSECDKSRERGKKARGKEAKIYCLCSQCCCNTGKKGTEKEGLHHGRRRICCCFSTPRSRGETPPAKPSEQNTPLLRLLQCLKNELWRWLDGLFFQSPTDTRRSFPLPFSPPPLSNLKSLRRRRPSKKIRQLPLCAL